MGAGETCDFGMFRESIVALACTIDVALPPFMR